MKAVEQKIIALSVLIPVYNWDIASLLTHLHEEISMSEFKEQVEIVIIDDGSTNAAIVEGNRSAADKIAKYIVLPQNIGRAAVRNMLINEAEGMYCLFLDSDVLPDQKGFLHTYFQYMNDQLWDVACGGVSYKQRIMTSSQYDFAVYLGNKTQALIAEERNKTSWRQILTANILVKKEVLEQVYFDEHFTGYGYEDTEWGIRLCEQKRVIHIDNSVSHLGLFTKETAYEKMIQSIPNYIYLAEKHPHVFGKSALGSMVAVLSKLPQRLLTVTHALLKFLFLGIPVVSLQYLVFQVGKAVLLSIEKSRRDSK